ncbi:MAG: YkgJ family cysteine cluster protein [Bacteroidetes bacterium]|nr:YkgJ family cysteine cluster protein [Bacteroidota bacterium]
MKKKQNPSSKFTSALQVETDLEVIGRMADDRFDENLSLRHHLKSLHYDLVNDLFASIHNHIAPLIDCTKCGNCCRTLQAAVRPSEIPVLANAKGYLPEEFQGKFLAREEGTHFLKHAPCIFFDGRRCEIYDHRPQACRDYPHLTQDNMPDRLFGVIDNYGTCPIVFNVVEELKRVTKFEERSGGTKSL